jgi:hypothetical protein
MNTTTATHTPGPWNVEHPYGEPGVYVAGPNTGLIAKLCAPDSHLFNADKPVSIDANARLIAAAPELLAALESALKLIATARQYFPKSLRDSDKFQLEQTCSEAGKAIAKATGTEGGQ